MYTKRRENVRSPLAAADEGPADAQDEDHEHEAGQDDVQHPPLWRSRAERTQN